MRSFARMSSKVRYYYYISLHYYTSLCIHYTPTSATIRSRLAAYTTHGSIFTRLRAHREQDEANQFVAHLQHGRSTS